MPSVEDKSIALPQGPVISGEAAVPWEQAGALIGVKSRKTINKLVKLGLLDRVPGVDRVLIIGRSLRRFLDGEANGGQA